MSLFYSVPVSWVLNILFSCNRCLVKLYRCNTFVITIGLQYITVFFNALILILYLNLNNKKQKNTRDQFDYSIIHFGVHDVMAGLALVRTARPAITGAPSWVGITSCKTILGGIPSVSFSSAVQQETRAECPPSLPQHQQMRAGFPPSLSHHPQTRAECPPSLPQHQQTRAGCPPSLPHQ